VLAVSVTLLFGLYVLGPDLFSRFVLGFIVPRKSVTLTRSEEISRAVIWCIGPLVLAWAWAKWMGPLDRLWNWPDVRTCFSGIYSEDFFRRNTTDWFHSTRMMLWLNYSLLWRLYMIVLLGSLLLNRMITKYESYRFRLRNHPKWRSFLAVTVLPRIAPWHLLLSRILLREEDLQIHLDIMTKANVLYQGRLADRMLGGDGSLLSITLDDPKRFKWDQYQEDRKEAQTQNRSRPVSNDYWKPISTNMFVIMGSEISTINLRYIPSDVAALRRSRAPDEDLTKALSELKIKVEIAKQESERSENEDDLGPAD
jgi:hypothetical protein